MSLPESVVIQVVGGSASLGLIDELVMEDLYIWIVLYPSFSSTIYAIKCWVWLNTSLTFWLCNSCLITKI